MSAKPNKAAISEDLIAWAKLEKQKRAIEAQLDLDLAPHNARFEKATKEIAETAAAELAKVNPQLTQLAAKIGADLLAGCNADTGEVLLPLVGIKTGRHTAIALVNSKPGARVVNPQKFFALARRLAGFWSCVTIGVAKSIELVGETTINTIATKSTKHSVELKLTELR